MLECFVEASPVDGISGPFVVLSYRMHIAEGLVGDVVHLCHDEPLVRILGPHVQTLWREFYIPFQLLDVSRLVIENHVEQRLLDIAELRIGLKLCIIAPVELELRRLNFEERLVD